MPSDEPSAGSHERELASLVEHLPAVLSYWDATQHCRFCNRAGARWWGIPADAIVGKHASELLGPLYGSNLPHMERVLRGEPQQFEREIPDPLGGAPRSSLIHYTPDIVDGSVLGFFVLVTDVSDLKQAQAALRSSEAHLLEIAQQLRDADRRKDEFLAVLGHELRNPLAAISNAGEFLVRMIEHDARMDVPLQILRRQTKQLCRLVDDLLDTARIAQGRIQLEDQPVELDDIVGQAVETVQPLAREKSQRLQVNKPGTTLYVRGDRARLVQSVGNILHNAAKYTGVGGEIELSVSASEQQVAIAVRDTGAGIAPEHLPHVFDSFEQRATLARSQSGLGIGLSLVKRLIALHRGTVQAESSGLGQGSTFTIRLPRLSPPRASAEEADPPRRTTAPG
jgi:PAS domain S-box-containing protein